MIKIAFIDDEQRILDGIRRMLHKRRKDWDMYFFDSGNAMLTSMEENTYDVVVSDMRMPVMSGAELLIKIKEISPKTIRIILSGYANEELVLESVHATHQFISKPTNQDALISHIERALRMLPILDSENAIKVLGNIESIPSLPAIYDALMQEVASEDVSLKRVADILSSDIGLSSSILRVVNSAFFGLVREINSLEEAASVLGIDMIKNLALQTKVFSSLTVPDDRMAEVEALNSFCQRVGILAALLAKHAAFSPSVTNHCQIAGMMSGLGDLLVLTDTALLIDNSAMPPPLLGSYLLSIWSMPLPTIEAVRWHQAPSSSGIDQPSPLAAVHTAWALLRAYDSEQLVSNELTPLIDYDYLCSSVDRSTVDNWVELTTNFCEG